MPDLYDIIKGDPSWGRDLITEYSFVLKKNLTSLGEGEKLVADFELGPGGWIVLAKATVKAESPGMDTVRLLLTATENQKVQEDRSLASVSAQGYATLSLMLGTHFSKGGKVELHALLQGALNCSLSNIVVTAIKTEKLLLGGL